MAQPSVLGERLGLALEPLRRVDFIKGQRGASRQCFLGESSTRVGERALQLAQRSPIEASTGCDEIIVFAVVANARRCESEVGELKRRVVVDKRGNQAHPFGWMAGQRILQIRHAGQVGWLKERRMEARHGCQSQR